MDRAILSLLGPCAVASYVRSASSNKAAPA